jgi:pimeloyl-ACP methyl ester carboxylesterase
MTWLSKTSERHLPVRVAYYAHLLHRGTPQTSDDVRLLQPDEQELFVALVDLLRGQPQAAQGRATVPIRQAAEWLTEHYGTASRRLVTMFVREVASYLFAPDNNRRIQARAAIADAIRQEQPKVLIAHSLGSVVAYEALWSNPDLEVELLITLGSPLGMNQVIFDRLLPEPVNGSGGRPPAVHRWVNIADIGDLVAVPRSLSGRFTDIEQWDPISIAAFDFHRVKNYLSCDTVTALLNEHGRQ